MTDLTDISASDLSGRLERKEVSAVEVMTAFLDRIELVNPRVNAIVSLRPREDLLAEAAAADKAPWKGWLHGMPLAVKDLANVKGLPTTSGSPLYADFIAPEDDPMVSRMRAAGGIFIGKTNVPEFALGSNTFNPVFGATVNPYDGSRTSGGSSGGAAAALACRLLPVADGSDAMGSLRNPAAWCNVYGFRPSFGLVPPVPQGETFLNQLSTEGPMARNVEDLARLLETLAEPDPAFPHSRGTERYASGLEGEIKGLLIGWLGNWGGAWPVEPGILEVCRDALGVFADLGASVEEVAPPYSAEALWESWTVLRHFSNAGGKGVLYADPEQRKHLKPEQVWEIERGLALSAMDLHRASLIRSDYFRALAKLFQRFDALVLPSVQVWPFRPELRYPQDINGQPMDTYHRWMEAMVPVSLVGVPALAAPAGFGDSGLPTGFQIFAPRGQDRFLLALGQAYHAATDWPNRRPPLF